MEYRIVLSRMEFRALHGCYELERKVGNRFTVDLELTAELGDAAAQDDVNKTVNYLTVYEVVRMQMRITQRTVERVAMNIIEAIYAAFAQVRHVNFYPTVGYDTEIIYMWVATGLHKTQMHLDDDEFLTPDRVPLQKAYEMVMSGEIKDGKTIAGVLKLKALLDEGKL